MKSYIDNQIVDAHNVFAIINSEIVDKKDSEYQNIQHPDLLDFQSFLALEEYQGITTTNFDENDLHRKMQLLADGEFVFKAIPDNFNDEAEVSEETNIFRDINENKFALTYSSPFDDIRTNNELHVDMTGRITNSFKTIADAIEESMPGDTIILEEGIYTESVVITKPIEIKARTKNGYPVTCIIDAKEQDGIVLRAAITRFTSITIKCDAPGNTFCVKGETGFFEINDCEIISHCAGAFALEEGSRLWAHGCRIKTDSKSITMLMPESRALFDNCKFFADVERLRSTSIDNPIINIGEKATGILNNCEYEYVSITFHQNSRGMLRQGTIKNVKSGITVLANAEVLLLEADIANCESEGICLNPDSKAVIQNCKIINNKSVGILVHGTQDFALVGTLLHGNFTGCRIYEGAKGSILESVFDSNVSAIQMESRCTISVRKSTFRNNTRSAILSTHIDESGRTFSQLNIHGSQFLFNKASIVLVKGIQCTVSQSTFILGEKEIVLQENSCLNMKDSVFGITSDVSMQEMQQQMPSQYAILVSMQSEAKITNTTIARKIKLGILSTDNSNLELSKCDIKCDEASINARNEATVNITNNSSIRSSITVKDDATINISESTVTYGSVANIIASDRSKILVSNKSTISNGKFGIQISGEVSCAIYDSKIEDILFQTNKQISSRAQSAAGSAAIQSTDSSIAIQSAGIYIQGSLQQPSNKITLDVQRTEFISAGQVAIYAENLFESSQFNIVSSTFCQSNKKIGRENTRNAILTSQVQGAIVKDCVFINITDECINMKNNSTFLIEGCVFKTECRAGIQAERSALNVSQCQFIDRLAFGIILKAGSNCDIRHSTFIETRTTAIQNDAYSNYTQEQNLFA